MPSNNGMSPVVHKIHIVITKPKIAFRKRKEGFFEGIPDPRVVTGDMDPLDSSGNQNRDQKLSLHTAVFKAHFCSSSGSSLPQ